MKTSRLAAVLLLSALPALACSKGETKGNQPSSNRQPDLASTGAAYTGKIDMEKAQVIFNERCSACHGTDGNGKGPASAALNPKPRNYRDKDWQTSVTDEQLRKTILLGGAGVGKSPIMPGSPDLDEKPEVVEGLVKIVRKFGS